MSDTPQARSIRQRLTNLAKLSGATPQDFLRLYLLDGFLMRLSQSQYVQHFVLGGGLFLFKVALGPARARVTQDSDFAIQGIDPTQLQVVVADIAALPGNDEIVFMPQLIRIQPIMVQNPALGLRVHLSATLGQAQDVITLDVTFDPIPWPGPQLRNVPGTLPSQPAAQVLTYPLEGIMAGKVESMLKRGANNTRYKDYWDIAYLAKTQDFGDTALGRPLHEVCAYHQTMLQPNEVFLDPGFSINPQQVAGWTRFITHDLRPPMSSPPNLSEIMQLVRDLYLPLLQGTAQGLTWVHQIGSWQ